RGSLVSLSVAGQFIGHITPDSHPRHGAVNHNVEGVAVVTHVVCDPGVLPFGAGAVIAAVLATLAELPAPFLEGRDNRLDRSRFTEDGAPGLSRTTEHIAPGLTRLLCDVLLVGVA